MRYDHISMLPEHGFRLAGKRLATLEGGKSSAPSAPDPVATANAQTASNKETAAFNAVANRNNIYTPYGSSTWTQTGTDSATGAPEYQQNVTLSPEQQALYNSNTQGSQMMQDTANQLMGNVQSQLGQKVDTSSLPGIQSNVSQSMGDPAIQNAINSQYKAQMGLMQPQFDQDKTALQAQLANQGITPGSEAYNNAMNNQARQQGVTMSQAANNATQQGMQYQNQMFGQNLSNANLQNSANNQQLQQMLALRNQPLNELSALRTGSQVQMPSVQATPTTNMAGTDTMGAQQMAYNGQMNAYNSDTASQNSTNSGLFSVGSMAIMAYAL
jgi:hypothetical protein